MLIPPAFFVLPVLLFCFCLISSCLQGIRERKKDKSSFGKVTLTNVTPVSMLEVQVTLPTIVIFGDKTVAKKYDPAALAQLPKLRLGEGTLGTLFKIVLDCGSIIAVRMIRPGLVGDENLESWIKFFGGIHGRWLLPMHFSFWYGGEAFILYDYLCLGSLEDLLHGKIYMISCFVINSLDFFPLVLRGNFKGKKMLTCISFSQCRERRNAIFSIELERKKAHSTFSCQGSGLSSYPSNQKW